MEKIQIQNESLTENERKILVGLGIASRETNYLLGQVGDVPLAELGLTLRGVTGTMASLSRKGWLKTFTAEDGSDYFVLAGEPGSGATWILDPLVREVLASELVADLEEDPVVEEPKVGTLSFVGIADSTGLDRFVPLQEASLGPLSVRAYARAKYQATMFMVEISPEGLQGVKLAQGLARDRGLASLRLHGFQFRFRSDLDEERWQKLAIAE
jgi:hypothetical protein